MPSELRDLTSVDGLEEAITASAKAPIVIFKHSPTCGTSAMAEEEVLEFIDTGGVPARVYRVQVRAHRVVSDAITARFGLRHESPQVLVLRDGKVLWSASHFRVTALGIAQKLREITARAESPAPHQR